MSDRLSLVQAELEVLELERKLIQAKDDGDLTHDLKLELREARRAYREMRSPADGGASPEVIETTAAVEK